MRKDSTEEDSAPHGFKVYAAKFPLFDLGKPLLIVAGLSLTISVKITLPLFGGFLIGFTIAVLLQAFRTSFEFKAGKLTIKEFAKIRDLDLETLIVESDAALGTFKTQTMTFRDRFSELSLIKLGSSKFLTAEGMLLLAALQRQGVFIDVLGFGAYTRGVTFSRQSASPSMVGERIGYLLFGAQTLLVSFLSLMHLQDLQQDPIGRTRSLPSDFTPIGIPALYIFGAAWVSLAIFLVIRAIEAKRGILPFAIDLSEDRVRLVKRSKEVFDLGLEEIRLVRVTAHDKGIDKDTVSVEIETHYARKYKMLEGGRCLPFGVNNFLEQVRRKGVPVVYQKLRKGADTPDVIWEAKAEKGQDVIESGKAQFTGPNETQVRQTEG